MRENYFLLRYSVEQCLSSNNTTFFKKEKVLKKPSFSMLLFVRWNLKAIKVLKKSKVKDDISSLSYH